METINGERKTQVDKFRADESMYQQNLAVLSVLHSSIDILLRLHKGEEVKRPDGKLVHLPFQNITTEAETQHLVETRYSLKADGDSIKGSTCKKLSKIGRSVRVLGHPRANTMLASNPSRKVEMIQSTHKFLGVPLHQSAEAIQLEIDEVRKKKRARRSSINKPMSAKKRKKMKKYAAAFEELLSDHPELLSDELDDDGQARGGLAQSGTNSDGGCSSPDKKVSAAI